MSDEGFFLLNKFLLKYNNKIFKESIEKYIIIGMGFFKDYKLFIVDVIEF